MKQLTLFLSIALLITAGVVFAQANPQQPAPAAPDQAQAQAGQSQSWSGNLVDAACKDKNATDKCPVSGTTSSFGLITSDGKYYKFDSAGNSAASRELQKAGSKTGDINATVSGSLDGDTIKVQSVRIQ